MKLTATKVRNARARAATHIDGMLWRVDGHHVLDPPDAYWSVRYDPATGKHDCSCYRSEDTLPGRIQRQHGCHHVAAVHLTLRRQRLVENRQAELAAQSFTRAVPSPAERRFSPPPEPPFDEWVTDFRPSQWDAIERSVEAFDEGAKVVMLQAPVGSGKTLAAETTRRLLGGRGLYICSTKSLQHQAARDFSYAAVLKGRRNYPTLLGAGATRSAWGARGRAGASSGAAGAPGREVTAADCTSSGGDRSCRYCDPMSRCPYRLARDTAIGARLSILNTSYFLADANRGGRKFAGRRLAIIDEADLLEGELLNQIEVNISDRRMRRLGMSTPERKTVESTWLTWVSDEAIPKVKRRIAELPFPANCTTEEFRERKSLFELLERLELLEVELPAGGWVYDGYKEGNVIFRPVEVGQWGRKLLWPHAERFLLMSGSIISADEMARTLGLDGDYRFIDIPMTFPAANRPINVVPIAEVTAKTQETAWPKIAEATLGVLALHPDERILVHTVSYPFAKFLLNALRRRTGRPLVTYTRAEDRDDALARYRATPGAVLLAPSMDRGIDLPGDACRVQVIAKVPYPNLGDKRTAARLYPPYNDEAWYAVNTVRTIVQMTGRGIRSAEDHATTYILDHSFTTNLWRKHKGLLPSWWCEAVNWRYPAHRLLRAAREHVA